MKDDPIIDRSPQQKIIRLTLLRLELRQMGYSVIKTDRLKQMIKRLPPADRVEAMMEATR